ncbi:AI-2E family transporter [Muribaculum intestinale]|uniref:AI-2E family transporter n=1 Tax=Muribaculum intestinale TaxID=1796646 RepID=A0A1V0QEG1_9BACT|nr:AI-2E family transporter [Muribaculum intestinale]ROS81814.1 AI-2E family transporter [Muribaculaceae bacterium Isolate-042 (Harlan)]ROT01820.1 AI-2E family transporter [Muribaculaceae bacterium Isolate-100 (HZI)]RXE63610.1 AI-2E family transporter [Muribaculaceae bacterium Isolate-007 (NCI)]ARE60784.1 AI-2E family transporter [Muribaculum intestinale]ASB36933.1 AI-2E family transporter [Muribaculum intestinale]
MSTSRPYTFDRVVRLVITTIVVCAAVWLIYRLRGVLLPFCVAALIAYIFEPFVQFNRELLRLKGRVAAIFITLFEATLAFGLLCYMLIPMITSEMAHMAHLLKVYSQSQVSIPFLPDWLHEFIRNYVDFEYLSSLLTREDQIKLLESAAFHTWSVLTSGISMIVGLLSWFIVFLYVIFIMLDYERLSKSLHHMVPPAWRKTVFRIGNDIQRSMNHYFRGQALVAFCVGVLFTIGFLIIGMPLAVVLGMFIGLLNMVPYLQLISLVPTIFLCLVCSVDQGVDFWTIFWECMAVYCVVQAIQDLFLTPKIMGKAMGLNPAIILLSLSIWGTLLGFLGLIIALPLTTLLLAYYDEYLNTLQLRHMRSRHHNDMSSPDGDDGVKEDDDHRHIE